MDAKSLRIGNTIDIINKNDGQLYKHQRITAGGLLDLDSNKDKSSFEYRPIPLFEDWLKKKGFEKKYISSKKYFLGKFSLFYNFDKNNKMRFYYKSLDNSSFQIENIHDLENLYYTLFKKEI